MAKKTVKATSGGKPRNRAKRASVRTAKAKSRTVRASDRRLR